MQEENHHFGALIHQGASDTGGMVNQIKKIRNLRGMTQKDVAELCGTTPQTIERLENNRRGLSQKWIDKVAKALEVDPGEIIAESLDRDIVSKLQQPPANEQYNAPDISPLACKFAILSVVSELAGRDITDRLTAKQVASLVDAFTADFDRQGKPKTSAEHVNRLQQSLEVVVAEILHSQRFPFPADYLHRTQIAVSGAAALILTLSSISVIDSPEQKATG